MPTTRRAAGTLWTRRTRDARCCRHSATRARQLQQAARPDATADQVRRALQAAEPQSRYAGRRDDDSGSVAAKRPASCGRRADLARAGRHSTRRVRDPLRPRAPRQGASAARGRRRSWSPVRGQLQPDEAERACVRRPRLGDGTRAGERPGTRQRRRRTGDLRRRCAAAVDDVLRGAHQGSHPRIVLRRRRPVRLRR